MVNKKLIQLCFAVAYIRFALMAVIGYPQFLGIVIFGFFVMLGAFRYFEKRQMLLTQQAPQHTVTQAHEYSMNKPESHDSIDDRPLSEAERNVVNGK